MRQKIIDDYCLYYLNDLFRIKLFFFTIQVECRNFLNLFGCYLFTIFSLQTQQIEVRLVAIQSAFYPLKPIPPFIFYCKSSAKVIWVFSISFYISQILIVSRFKERDWLDMVVELKVEYCREIFQGSFDTNETFLR